MTEHEIIVIDRADALALAGALPLDQNPAVVYLASLGSDRSRHVMRQALDTIAKIVDPDANAVTLAWHQLRYQHTQFIRARLQETVSETTGKPLSAATVNRMLSALRQTLYQAWKLGLMGADDYQRAVDLKRARGKTVPAGRDLSEGEIAALMLVCERDPSPAGPRDAAIIALGATWGLRRAEFVALDLADYDREAGRLLIRGKGNKERTAYPYNGALGALADWLRYRGEEPGALFLPVNRGGNIVVEQAGQPARLTSQAIYNMLRKRAAQAGVSEFSPHDLRRTTAGDLLDAGVDMSTVAAMLGHASVVTTQRYDRRGERAKQDAAGRLHVPYRRRWHD